MANRTVQCVTYDMNDVINLDEIDLDGNPDSNDVFPKRRKKTDSIGISRKNIPFSSDYELEGIGIVTIVDSATDIYDKYLDDYDVEEEKNCDSTKRPSSYKTCNTNPCPLFER